MRKSPFIILVFLLTIPFSPAFAPDFPKPTGWVSDYAGVIDSQSYQKMTAVIQELEQKTGAEIAVVTLKNLGNESIETLSVKLFKEWGIGKKGKDNGVLLIYAIEDKKARIEVGYGFEGILPDGLVGEILDKHVIPYFKKGAFSEGITMGTLAIVSIIAKDAGVQITGRVRPTRQVKKMTPIQMLVRFIILIALGFLFIRNPFLFLLFLGMAGGRGGGFSSGGFGGGFGGFGGGMSGGGGAGR